MTDKRTEVVKVRLTKEEYRVLKRKAVFVEQMTVSQWIRNRLFPSKEVDEPSICDEPIEETKDPYEW